MNSHKHARLTPKGRALLVGRVLDEGWTVADASMAAGVSKRTGYKWLARFKAEGPAGLADRSSRPQRCPRALTPQQQRQLEELRRQRWPLWRIALQARRGMGTVSRCMKRLGLSRHEYGILEKLLGHPDWIYSREKLMALVWDDPDTVMPRTVDAHIKSLRAKLREVIPERDPIQTHRGFGYSLRGDA